MEDHSDEPAAGVKLDPKDTGPTPVQSAETSDRVDYLRQAISALPHDLKTTLILYQYEGMSYKEIAVVLGCSPKGVETLLYRTRKQLKRVLQPKFSETEHISATPDRAAG